MAEIDRVFICKGRCYLYENLKKKDNSLTLYWHITRNKPEKVFCDDNSWLLRHERLREGFCDVYFKKISAPPAPQPPGIMNNGSRDNTKDIQKLQQQLQDIKDQVPFLVWRTWTLLWFYQYSLNANFCGLCCWVDPWNFMSIEMQHLITYCYVRIIVSLELIFHQIHEILMPANINETTVLFLICIELDSIENCMWTCCF